MKVDEIDTRTVEILRTVIEEYIASGEPVGSRTISKNPRFSLSAATIRNIMADLEEMGHLCQPHTSAGRIPTEKGYRWFVDHLRKVSHLPRPDEQLIRDSFGRTGSELDDALVTATQLLAQLSHYAGVIVTPRIDTAVLAHLDMARLSAGRILVIIVTTSGAVQHKVVDLPEDYSTDDLQRFARFLEGAFTNLTLREVRSRISERLHEERAAYDRLAKAALAIAEKSFEELSPSVRIEGTVNILDAPEFADVDKLRALLRAFEDKERILCILDEVIDGRGLHVIIGSETQIADLSGLSVVSATYRAGDTSGALGVIGPTRMDYDRTVTVVERIAKLLSQRLAPHEPTDGDRHV